MKRPTPIHTRDPNDGSWRTHRITRRTANSHLSADIGQAANELMELVALTEPDRVVA